LAAKFDLTLNAQEQTEQLYLDLGSNAELFDESTVSRMLRHFQNLLESIIAEPEQRTSDLRLLTAGEEKQLLEDWNQTQAEFPQRVTIHDLFYQQVKRTPSAVAVSDARRQLTYAELNGWANHVARRLRGLGVGPDVLVGIMMERSVQMVVALLGVLKSGGAYVPLDVNYPQERLRFMIDDADLRVVIAQAELEVLVPEVEVITVEDLTTDTELESGASAENLAYIIYTSGSTGLPKGVMIPHSSLCNHMLWMQSAFPLEKTDRVLQKTATSFDASVWEFYAPLLTGAQLVMAEPEAHMDGRFLTEQIRKYGITTIQMVPSLLKLCLDEPDFRKCDSLTRVFCGGEALTVDLVRRFKESGPKAELYNLYGPTETTIDATYSRCEIDDVSIGRPVSNTQTYLLDESMQPVPVGIPAELYIGGLNLGRGYLRRPDITASNFVPNPFSAQPGARLYKSGDLARYRSDGQLQYLGRIDSQVKLRGFRIELEEIASVLRQHPEISDALVLAERSSTGDQRLVSYVVSESMPTHRQLRSYLQERLPEYMIPSRMVLVHEIPLLPNGKVDRRALERAGAVEWERDDERQHVGPRNPAEEKLVLIWEKVLGVTSVGVDDNFFEMGGHSLLATQLISRIRDEFMIDLPLRSVFASPTPAEMARVIEAAIIEQLEGISEAEIEALAS
jgi:amino acid adenylation domain-containing protein